MDGEPLKMSITFLRDADEEVRVDYIILSEYERLISEKDDIIDKMLDKIEALIVSEKKGPSNCEKRLKEYEERFKNLMGVLVFYGSKGSWGSGKVDKDKGEVARAAFNEHLQYCWETPCE